MPTFEKIVFFLIVVVSGNLHAEVAESSWWDAVYAASERMEVQDFSSSWQSLDLQKLQEALGDRLSTQKARNVLVLGCGDSRLAEDLYGAGFLHITAMDFSTRATNLRASSRRSNAATESIRWLTEDARRQTSLNAASFDLVLELGTLDIATTGGDGGEGAAGLLREIRRLLRAGGVFISVSTEPPLFRLPLLAKHPAGGWTDETEVLRIPRPRSLDPRLVELNPDWEVNNLAAYIVHAAGQVETPAEDDHTVPFSAEASNEKSELVAFAHESGKPNLETTDSRSDYAQTPDQTASSEPERTTSGSIHVEVSADATVAQEVPFVQQQADEVMMLEPVVDEAESTPAPPPVEIDTSDLSAPISEDLLEAGSEIAPPPPPLPPVLSFSDEDDSALPAPPPPVPNQNEGPPSDNAGVKTEEPQGVVTSPPPEDLLKAIETTLGITPSESSTTLDISFEIQPSTDMKPTSEPPTVETPPTSETQSPQTAETPPISEALPERIAETSHVTSIQQNTHELAAVLSNNQHDNNIRLSQQVLLDNPEVLSEEPASFKNIEEATAAARAAQEAASRRASAAAAASGLAALEAAAARAGGAAAAAKAAEAAAARAAEAAAARANAAASQ